MQFFGIICSDEETNSSTTLMVWEWEKVSNFTFFLFLYYYTSITITIPLTTNITHCVSILLNKAQTSVKNIQI